MASSLELPQAVVDTGRIDDNEEGDSSPSRRGVSSLPADSPSLKNCGLKVVVKNTVLEFTADGPDAEVEEGRGRASTDPPVSCPLLRSDSPESCVRSSDTKSRTRSSGISLGGLSQKTYDSFEADDGVARASLISVPETACFSDPEYEYNCTRVESDSEEEQECTPLSGVAGGIGIPVGPTPISVGYAPAYYPASVADGSPTAQAHESMAAELRARATSFQNMTQNCRNAIPQGNSGDGASAFAMPPGQMWSPMQQVQMPQTQMACGQLQNPTQVQARLASQPNGCGSWWPSQLEPDNAAPPGNYSDFHDSPIDPRPRSQTSPNGYNDVPQRFKTDPCNSNRGGNFGGYGDARQNAKNRSQSDNVGYLSFQQAPSLGSKCTSGSADTCDYGNGYCNDFVPENYSNARRRSTTGSPNFQPWQQDQQQQQQQPPPPPPQRQAPSSQHKQKGGGASPQTKSTTNPKVQKPTAEAKRARPKQQAQANQVDQAVEAPAQSDCNIPKEEWTTVMLRNLPNDYTREMLISLLDGQGFEKCYDFVYMPIDFHRKAGLGYAFVNMVTHANAEQVHQKLMQFEDWETPSQKVLDVCWSEPSQGLEAHIERYRNSPVMHPDVADKFKPVLFDHGVPVVFPGPTKRIRPPRLKHGNHKL